MTNPIKIEKLSKTNDVCARKGLFKSEHRSVEALKSVTLEVNQGEVFGLLGPNGTIKTTLIKILTTLLLPNSGSAWINGNDVITDENKVRGSVGCMLMSERGLYWKLTGRAVFTCRQHIAARLKRCYKPIIRLGYRSCGLVPTKLGCSYSTISLM